MDQMQVQQQQHQQQVVMQQQQQQQRQQQVSSSVQTKTVKQVQEYQTYQSSGGSQGGVQYQLPPQQTQQTFQNQTTQQTVSSSGQPMPQGMEHNVPVQMRPAGPTQHQGPRHGVPTPFVNMNSMVRPQPTNQNVSPSQFANQNAAPPQQFSRPNAAPPQQFANQGTPPPQQFVNQSAPPPQQFANQNAPPPQQSFQNVNAQPQNQHATQNASPAQGNQAALSLASASERVNEPIYTSGTTQDNPDGYTSAYSAIRGEWPPKQENGAPNLTTTYPSGFKLKDHATFQTGPAKVVTSQPAFKITQPIRKSGDDKWPPRGSGEPTQEEVREFIKPMKSNKNYEEFFAQNALPHNYAGYRAPPGTQHFGLDEEEEDDGVSNM